MPSEALRDLGYTVLHAEGATKALQILAERPDIDLLFSDIVMPEMSGRKLAEEAHKQRPSLKVLYTMGFSRNGVIHNGVLDSDVKFLPRPFTLDDLARKLASVLGD